MQAKVKKNEKDLTKGKRTSITINKEMAEMLKKATVEATKKANTPIKQTELINYLIKHKLNEAIRGIIEEMKS